MFSNQNNPQQAQVSNPIHHDVMPAVIGTTIERLYQWTLITPIEEIQVDGRKHIAELILLMIDDLKPLTPYVYEQFKKRQDETNDRIVDLEKKNSELEVKLKEFLKTHQDDVAISKETMISKSSKNLDSKEVKKVKKVKSNDKVDDK